MLPELLVEMVSNTEHPITAKNIGGALGINITCASTPNTGIGVEDIVELELSHQLVVEKTPANVAIPDHNRAIGGEGASLRLPGIRGVGIDLEIFYKIECYRSRVGLRPVANRYGGIDAAHLVEIGKIGIKLQRIFIRYIFI